MSLRMDLHLHTQASDGVLPAELLVARAALAGLNVLAITEHDNIDSWPVVKQSCEKYGIRAIPGIEISTSLDGRDIHMLAYDFSPRSRVLADLLRHQHDLREKRFRKILRRLAAEGIRVDRRNIHTELTQSPGRVHIALALVKQGAVSEVQEAFDKFLGPGQSAFVPHQTVSPADAIDVIHRAGGIASLAHPVFSTNREKVLDTLSAAGVDAIEVLHPRHSIELQSHLISYAKGRKLMRTGGSDWHGVLAENYDLGEWYILTNGVRPDSPFPRLLEDAAPCRGRKTASKKHAKH